MTTRTKGNRIQDMQTKLDVFGGGGGVLSQLGVGLSIISLILSALPQ